MKITKCLRQLLTALFVITFLASQNACSTAGSPDPAATDDTTPNTDGTGDGSNTADDGTTPATPAEAPTLTQQVNNPCYAGTEIAYAIKYISSTEVYIGCAGSTSGSIYHSTDAGTTWTELTATGGISDMRTYMIDTDAIGRVYFCGVDNDVSPTRFVYRYTSSTDTWENLLDTSTADGTSMTACENIVTYDATDNGDASDTVIVVEGLAGQSLWESHDDGATWSVTYYWEESALDLRYDKDADGIQDCEESVATSYNICKAYQITDLVFLSNGSLYAAGSTETENPRFFSPSTVVYGDPVRTDTTLHPNTLPISSATAPGDRLASRSADGLLNMKMSSVSTAINGEARFLITLDDGITWLTGGRSEGGSGDTAWIAKSVDGGLSWTFSTITLVTTDDGNTDIINDVACNADGQTCVAAGLKYPFASYGGMIFVSKDAGSTWTEYTGSFNLDDIEMWQVAWNGDNFLVTGFGEFNVTGTKADITSYLP